jgi:hypothetical protein
LANAGDGVIELASGETDDDVFQRPDGHAYVSYQFVRSTAIRRAERVRTI